MVAAEIQLLLVAEPAAGRFLSQGFEMPLSRRRCKEDQHRGRFAGFVTETMSSTLRHIEEVSRRGIDPTFSIERAHHAAQDEK